MRDDIRRRGPNEEVEDTDEGPERGIAESDDEFDEHPDPDEEDEEDDEEDDLETPRGAADPHFAGDRCIPPRSFGASSST